MSKTISLLSALLCTFIWGTTFIAQDTGMDNIGPYVFNSVRFFVGFIALIPFYLFLEKNTPLSEEKLRRLNLISKIDSLGAGFSIAANDLDIRGAGNIVGSEQSGHIKEVGIELYYKMLNEAISEL